MIENEVYRCQFVVSKGVFSPWAPCVRLYPRLLCHIQEKDAYEQFLFHGFCHHFITAFWSFQMFFIPKRKIHKKLIMFCTCFGHHNMRDSSINWAFRESIKRIFWIGTILHYFSFVSDVLILAILSILCGISFFNHTQAYKLLNV